MAKYPAIVDDVANNRQIDLPPTGEIAGHVAYQVQQSLNSAQQTQALANIGAQAALGFTPARATTPFTGATSQQSGNIAVGSNSPILSVTFSASAASMMIVATADVVSTAIAIQTNVVLGVTDKTSGAALGGGAGCSIHSSIANGFCPIMCLYIVGSLTIGDQYTATFYAGQVTAASSGTTQIANAVIGGTNL